MKLSLKKVCRINRLNPYLRKLRSHPRAGDGECAIFQARDGWPIYYRSWFPAGYARIEKIVLGIHGLHGHGEKFALLADRLADEPWATFAIDLRGHGLSWTRASDLGDIDNYTVWIKDVLDFLYFLDFHYPGVPVHIIAESMGATLALHVALSKPSNLRSLILLSPAFKTWKLVEFLTMLATAIFGLLGPYFKHTIPVVSQRHIDTNNPIYKQYESSDLLRLVRVTPRYYFQVQKMINRLGILKNPCACGFQSRSFYPTLLFYGGSDQLVDFRGDQKFIQYIKSSEKALHFISRT